MGNNIFSFFSGIPEFFSNFWDTLKNFFISLVVPEDDYFQNLYNDLFERITSKFPYEVYVDALRNLQEITEGDIAGLDVNFSNYSVGDTGVYISTPDKWVPFEFVLNFRSKWFTWVRVFCWIFSSIYTINQVIKVFRGSIASDGAIIHDDKNF